MLRILDIPDESVKRPDVSDFSSPTYKNCEVILSKKEYSYFDDLCEKNIFKINNRYYNSISYGKYPITLSDGTRGTRLSFGIGEPIEEGNHLYNSDGFVVEVSSLKKVELLLPLNHGGESDTKFVLNVNSLFVENVEIGSIIEYGNEYGNEKFKVNYVKIDSNKENTGTYKITIYAEIILNVKVIAKKVKKDKSQDELIEELKEKLAPNDIILVPGDNFSNHKDDIIVYNKEEDDERRKKRREAEIAKFKSMEEE